MPFVRNAGVQIHYEVEGDGPPVVFHTGAGGDLEMWRLAGYMERLHGFRRILIDQRGRGASDRPPTIADHQMERFVEDVALVLDAVGEPSAGFWGYSNGMAVGIAVGASHPDRIRCLIGTGGLRLRDLSDLPRVDPEEEIRQDVAGGGVAAELENIAKSQDERFPPPIDANVRAGDPRMHALMGLGWRNWKGPKSALASFRAPILFITGEKEDPTRQTEITVAATPRSRIVRVPGVGHLGAFYRSDLAVPIALPFLTEHVR